IWSGSYLIVGYLFSQQLETIVGYASSMGPNLVLLIGALFGIWIGWKFLQRRRFLRQLQVARITPAELWQVLPAGGERFLVDVRVGLGEERALIAGAVRISPEELAVRSHEVPRVREIILFCT